MRRARRRRVRRKAPTLATAGDPCSVAWDSGAFGVTFDDDCLGGAHQVWLRARFTSGRLETETEDHVPDDGTFAGPFSDQPRLRPIEARRVYNIDRIATAIAVSEQYPGGTRHDLVLASALNYPDALIAGPLAVALEAPILLTGPDRLDPRTETAMSRHSAGPGVRVHLLGGPQALSPAIEALLRELRYTVIRYGGTTRYGTAVAVAEALGGPGNVIEASGTDFPDALVAGVAAARTGSALLLTAGSEQAPETAAYLADHPGTRTAIGHAAAVADPGATAIVGADRYETAAAVATQLFPSGRPLVGVASGTNYPDALTGGASIASREGVLLLTAPTAVPGVTESWLHARRETVTDLDVFGGPAAISEPVVDAIERSLD